uniref:Transposase n=1 Tax=Hydatigena taeniaeformis TaxID=6205 RepID=A0A0R3XBR7_HYDTA
LKMWRRQEGSFAETRVLNNAIGGVSTRRGRKRMTLRTVRSSTKSPCTTPT